MSGRKPKRAALFELNLPSTVCSTETLLTQLGCTETQRQAFYQVNESRLQQALMWCEQAGHHLVLSCDANYPPLLRYLCDAPLVLFVLGEVAALSEIQLAMVGSRHYSDYGKQWAYQFAYELAAAGVVITSGLALGIDSVCHRAALDAKGRTIAVLGSGLKHITPRSHSRLAEAILQQQGAVVSEFMPDEKALPQHFPKRNRIISGLSQGVMVVEAAIKSGSLITARCALEQGRDIYALPGAIDAAGSEGTNWLIQQGAYLVTSPQDILHQLSGTLHWLPTLSLSDSEITEALPETPYPDVVAQLSAQPVPVDRLAERLHLPVTEVMMQLVELELLGVIRGVSGGYIRNLSKVSQR